LTLIGPAARGTTRGGSRKLPTTGSTRGKTR
jgi:hypothetical protein